MSRAVTEWIGANDNTAIPPRVRVRVFDRAGGKCQCCTRKLYPGDKWEADHIVALINGGMNREANLQCLCDWCHANKTRSDVATKALTARKRAKHVLASRPKSRLQGRPFDKSPPQHSATRPLKRSLPSRNTR